MITTTLRVILISVTLSCSLLLAQNRPLVLPRPVPTPASAGASTTPPVRVIVRPIWITPNGWRWRRPDIVAGFNPFVRLMYLPRLESAQALPLESQLDTFKHDPAFTGYRLWVPQLYRHATPAPLILWVSSQSVPEEFTAWDGVVAKYGILFAAVLEGGNDVSAAKRMRLTVEVFEDLRRRMNIDPDRIYLAGFSEGAKTASDFAHTWPEFVGGALAIGGSSGIRQEPWVRERIKERLSLAMITGENDPARLLMETRFKNLRDAGMRTRLWTVPRMGHGMPPTVLLEQAYLWLESGVPERQFLAIKYPTSKIVAGVVPSPEEWAAGLVEEAKIRMREEKTKESGLLLLEGVMARWKTTEAAKVADKLLDGSKSKEIWLRRQREHYHREAQALDALRRAENQAEVIALWELVEKLGADTPEGRQATKRLGELRKR
jgi:predicted esterase